MESRDQWLKIFNKKVPPVLDHYLKEAVERTTFRISRQEKEELITSIKHIIRIVAQDGSDYYVMMLSGRDDADMARILNPYVEKFLPYGPVFMRTFIGYEALSRFGYTASVLMPVSYIAARVFEMYAPESYAVIDGLLTNVDATQFSHIRKLLGYTNQDGSDVLLRQQYDLTGVLYRMAMPSHEGWPNKRQDVSQWAKDYLESLYEWASFNWDLQVEIGSFLKKLERGG